MTRRKKEERRSKYRFAIERELRFKVIERGNVVATGTGQTIDISSGGVAFQPVEPVTAGSLIELSISWPVLLDESCLMRLIVVGRVLRSGRRCAASIDRYEFRTQGRSVQPSTLTRTDPLLRRWAESLEKGAKQSAPAAEFCSR